MKEFYSTTGGRHIYNADFKDLQDSIIAATELFRACGGNFVISGCEYDSDNEKVNSGYVWLDGKLRMVEETSVTSLVSLCIVASDSAGESVSYADGTAHKRNDVYGTSISNQSAASGIVYDLNKGRFPNLADVFFNYYALLKDNDAQTVNSSVSFGRKVVLSDDGAEMSDGVNVGGFYLDSEGAICLKASSSESGTIYKMSQNGMISAYNGDELMWSIDGNSGSVSISLLSVNTLSANNAEIDNLSVDGQISAGGIDVSGSVSAYQVDVSGNATVDGRATVNEMESNEVVSKDMSVSRLLKCSSLNVTGVAIGAFGRCVHISSHEDHVVAPGDSLIVVKTADVEITFNGLVKDGTVITVFNISNGNVYLSSDEQVIYDWPNPYTGSNRYRMVSGQAFIICYCAAENAWFIFRNRN